MRTGNLLPGRPSARWPWGRTTPTLSRRAPTRRKRTTGSRPASPPRSPARCATSAEACGAGPSTCTSARTPAQAMLRDTTTRTAPSPKAPATPPMDVSWTKPPSVRRPAPDLYGLWLGRGAEDYGTPRAGDLSHLETGRCQPLLAQFKPPGPGVGPRPHQLSSFGPGGHAGRPVHPGVVGGFSYDRCGALLEVGRQDGARLVVALLYQQQGAPPLQWTDTRYG